MSDSQLTRAGKKKALLVCPIGGGLAARWRYAAGTEGETQMHPPALGSQEKSGGR